MNNIKVDFSKSAGKIKPMHAVNNGPVYKFAADQRITNLDSYRDAGIPYARTHDASFYSTYGGEHTVDVHAIFPNFDADPYDEASYDFTLTDNYLKVIELANTKVFYRLGSKIEHNPKKYGTLPPKDFHKWAVICEHIIKHFNHGWADGYNMNIEYWEIWNEPDLDEDDSDHKRTWGGTKQQFFELYDIAASHLKKCFPEIKIGGPALAFRTDWAEDFLTQLKAPLDFFSWHIYATDPSQICERANFFRALLDKHGYTKTESILNEWNYVKGWENDEWVYTLRAEKGLKGASFIASSMCGCQKVPLDILMYYDARPCAMNGMFRTDLVCDLLKGYYPFRMFNELYKLQNAVYTDSDSENLYTCAAAANGEAAVLISHFNDDDSAAPRETKISFKDFAGKNGAEVEIYLLDEEHDAQLVRTETMSSENFGIVMNISLFDTYLIKIKAL